MSISSSRKLGKSTLNPHAIDGSGDVSIPKQKDYSVMAENINNHYKDTEKAAAVQAAKARKQALMKDKGIGGSDNGG